MLEMEHYDDFLEHFRKGETEIVVSTDQTVHGIDFSFLEVLYLIEVPTKAVD